MSIVFHPHQNGQVPTASKTTGGPKLNDCPFCSIIKPEVEEKLEKEVKSDTRLDPVVSDGETAVIPGVVGALAFQAEQRAQGFSGLNCDDTLISEPAEVGFVNLRYGFSQMGKVKEEHVAIIREVLEDFECRLKNWEGFMDLEKSFVEKIEADDEKVKMYYTIPVPSDSIVQETTGVLLFVYHGRRRRGGIFSRGGKALLNSPLKA